MWKIEYTKRFLKELSKLPKEVQTHAEKIVLFVYKSTVFRILLYSEASLNLLLFQDKYNYDNC